MILYRLLLPPPRQRTVIRPVLLRPPLPRSPSVKALTGFPFHNSLRSTVTSCRRDGVVGLKVFNAIASDPRRHVDPLSLAERDDRLFVIRTPAEATAKTLELALHPDRIDRFHLYVEQPLDRRLDFALRGGKRHAKDYLVVFGDVRGLFGDHRSPDDIVHLLASQLCLGARDDAKPTHLRRSSRRCTASRVRTSMSRRRMS